MAKMPLFSGGNSAELSEYVLNLQCDDAHVISRYVIHKTAMTSDNFECSVVTMLGVLPSGVECIIILFKSSTRFYKQSNPAWVFLL